MTRRSPAGTRRRLFSRGEGGEGAATDKGISPLRFGFSGESRFAAGESPEHRSPCERPPLTAQIVAIDGSLRARYSPPEKSKRAGVKIPARGARILPERLKK